MLKSIFNEFSSFLNYFDPSVDIELSYINRIGKNEEVEKCCYYRNNKCLLKGSDKNG